MSHFAVMVRLGKDETLEDMLAPYQENNMDDCPREFLTFHDVEDEELERYNTGTTTAFIDPQGKAHSEFEKEFERRTPRTRGERSTCAPDGWTTEEVPFARLWPTFEVWMAEYNGTDGRDPDKGRFGYWENPKAKWDWYQVGGRWTGTFTGYEPSKDPANVETCFLCAGTGTRLDGQNGPGGCNGCRGKGKSVKWPTQWKPHPGDVVTVAWLRQQMPKMLDEGRRRAAEFVVAYEAARTAKKFEGSAEYDPFSGPRHDAVERGLVRCLNEDELESAKLPPGTVLVRWERSLKEGVPRFDACLPVPDGFVDEWWSTFITTLSYAFLDRDGWREPGEMGWWGVSHATSDSRLSYRRGQLEWIMKGDAADRVVMVDCHI